MPLANKDPGHIYVKLAHPPIVENIANNFGSEFVNTLIGHKTAILQRI